MGESRDVILTYAHKPETSRGKLTLKSTSPKIKYSHRKSEDPSRPCLMPDVMVVSFTIGLISEDGAINESFEEHLVTRKNGIHIAHALFGGSPWDLKGHLYRDGKFTGTDTFIFDSIFSKDDFYAELIFASSKDTSDASTVVYIREIKH